MALPRAVQIVSGLILLAWTGLCLAGSIAVLLMVIRGFAVMFFMFPIVAVLAGTVESGEALIAVLFNLWVAYGLFRSTADDGGDEVEEDDDLIA